VELCDHMRYELLNYESVHMYIHDNLITR
jgi:hypothetical protein